MISKNIIENYVKEHQDEAVTLLEELGKIPAPSHQEDLRAAFCADWLRKHTDGEVSVDAAKNVICKFEKNPKDAYVVMAAHTDVVFPDTEPLPMVREGNILRAPGIGDDTANLVNLMFVGRYLSENRDRLTCNVLVVANSCEEGLGNLDGTKQLFADYGSKISRFISLDGNLGGLVNVPVGSHRYRMVVHTQGGHSYGDYGRDNAIEIAARVIGELYAIEVPKHIKTTTNVGVIQGGTTVNSIAQDCEFLYEYRSEDQKCLEYMQDKVQAVIADFQEKGKDVHAEILGIRPGMGDVDRDALNIFTTECMDIVKEFYEGPTNIGAGSTDANIPLSKGIIGVTLGTITGHGAHTREEWVELDSLPTGLKIALKLAENWLE